MNKKKIANPINKASQNQLLKMAFFFFMLFACMRISFAQRKQLDFIYKGKIDSVIISTYYCFNKELSDVGDTTEIEAITIVDKKKLNNSEIMNLNTFLKSKDSFLNTKVLLNHSDINISYYLRDSIVQELVISSVTSSINIIRKIRQSVMKNEITDESHCCFFKDKISRSFEKHLTALLIKKHMWSKGHKFGIDN